jgi:arylsulfatase A-like enzyme
MLAVDDAVRSIVETLDARGDLDRTLIVFVSDNGFSFGEHRWGKKACPYEPCTHVPLLVRYPSADPRVVESLVSTIDLAPTIADVAGLEPFPDIDGASLVPLLERGEVRQGGEVLLEWAGDSAVPAWWQVRTPAFSYIELGTGERELYDLRRDPDQLTNVVDRPSYAAVVARLAAELGRFRDG